MQQMSRNSSASWPNAILVGVSARFRCSLALAQEGKLLETFEGVVEGTIVEAPRGAGGFGYDPVFQPQGFDQTFGELSAAEKNRISHRAQRDSIVASCVAR